MSLQDLIYLDIHDAAIASVRVIDIERTRTNRNVVEIENEYTKKIKNLMVKILRRNKKGVRIGSTSRVTLAITWPSLCWRWRW